MGDCRPSPKGVSRKKEKPGAQQGAGSRAHLSADETNAAGQPPTSPEQPAGGPAPAPRPLTRTLTRWVSSIRRSIIHSTTTPLGVVLEKVAGGGMCQSPVSGRRTQECRPVPRQVPPPLSLTEGHSPESPGEQSGLCWTPSPGRGAGHWAWLEAPGPLPTAQHAGSAARLPSRTRAERSRPPPTAHLRAEPATSRRGSW